MSTPTLPGWRIWSDRGWMHFTRPDGFTQAVTDHEPHLSHAETLHMLLEALAAPVEKAAPADPMDWPLPCDVRVGHGTMRKGVKLRTLVTRMKVLYEMATGENADAVAARKPEQGRAMLDEFLAAAADAGVTHLSAQQAAQPVAPIDMVLHCPACGMQHIDAPEWVDDPHDIEQGRILGWKNEPHRSHLCHGCGHIWRPADVPTNGVVAVKTQGKADSPIAGPRVAQPVAGEPAPMTLTDLEIIQRGHRMAWRYKYSSDPAHSSTYTFNDHCLIEFVRALGIKAGKDSTHG